MHTITATSNFPKISVITIVRNGEKYLEDTITSILRQTYKNLEYIVIDGASTDGTVDIIRKYASRINYWTSEKDDGIYDAMNKGVKASTGDWLLFINADDFLASDQAIESAVKYLASCSSWVAYGNVVFLSADEQEIHGREWKNIKYEFQNIGMRLPHQGTFHSRQLFANRGFDPTFKITGDYDLLLSYLKSHDAVYFPVTISKMRAGGISDSVSKVKLFKETYRAQIQNGVYSIPSFNWFLNAFKVISVHWVIQTFGKNFKNRIKAFAQ